MELHSSHLNKCVLTRIGALCFLHARFPGRSTIPRHSSLKSFRPGALFQKTPQRLAHRYSPAICFRLKSPTADLTFNRDMQSVFSGPVYVVRDNIDTDQIIPAQYLNLIPTIKEEYDKLGSYAMCGLPDSLYPTRFIAEGKTDSQYPIIIGGRNFGCGSSREHAPIALGAAECRVVVAESFARIFFRNSVATGELYPCECTERLCEAFKTGDVATVDLDAQTVKHNGTGKVYSLKPLGDVRPVVDAGGLFNYARKTGMMAAAK